MAEESVPAWLKAMLKASKGYAFSTKGMSLPSISSSMGSGFRALVARIGWDQKRKLGSRPSAEALGSRLRALTGG